MLEAAVFGAYFNVMINLKDITDEKFKLAVSRGCACALALVVGMRWDRDGDEAPGTPHAWAPLPLPSVGCMEWMVDGYSVLSSGKRYTFFLPMQMSQKVSRLLEEAKQGSALVLALLEKRGA